MNFAALKHNRPLPIGIDIGSSRVKLAQLRPAADQLELLAAGSIDIPRELNKDRRKKLDYLTDRLGGVLKSNSFKGRTCILSVPTNEIFVQHIRLPRMATEQVQNALGLEMQGKLPYPTHEAIIRHVIAGEVYCEGEAKQEVIVVAVRRSNLEQYLQMAEKAKLDVIGVNIESCAMVECFARLLKRASDTAKTILYIDIGATCTKVALSQGSHLAFARNLDIGGEHMDQVVADGLGVLPEQAQAMRWDLRNNDQPSPASDALYKLLDCKLGQLADQLTQCLRYYESVFRNEGIERTIFVGGQAYDKRLCQSLAQRLNLPAQVGDPLVRVKRIEGAGTGSGLERKEPQPDWAIAVGLSLGAAKSTKAA